MELYSESILDRKLFEKVKDFTWLIEAVYREDTELILSNGSGFSVNKDGLIMTCAHIFQCTGELLYINARNNSEDDLRDADIVKSYPALDVTILQVNSPLSYKSGQFASNGSLYPGQPLAYVGNPFCYPGSFDVGRSSYHCVDLDIDSVKSLIEDNQNCATYTCTALSKTPQYRVMGHYFNSVALSDTTGTDFEKKLHPLLPVVRSCGLDIHGASSGSPLFKSDGTIIGMVIYNVLSVHVSMLRACLEDFLSNRETSPPI